MEHKKLSPNFFFLLVGMLITLIASITTFLQLAFRTFDIVLPDALTSSYRSGYYSYSYDGVRSALATLIIVFPAFLALSHFWQRVMKKHLSHWDEVFFRWVLYLVLFLAGVTVIVDLVTLVQYFVSGEITIRFLLKVAVTLIAAGLVGWYYIRRLRRSAHVADPRMYLFLGVAIFLVLGLIVYSFSVIGAPGSQRKLRLDQRRVDDLQSIQWQLVSFWQQKEMLPETLAELSNPLSSYMVPEDPEFQKGFVYEYRKFSNTKFELCATFAAPIPKGWVPDGGYGGGYPMRDISMAEPAAMPVPGGIDTNWDHDIGRTCFQREIDPELYPSNPRPAIKQ